MTKAQIRVAAFLRDTHETAMKLADLLDPKRKMDGAGYDGFTALGLDGIASKAAYVFRHVTGKSPRDVGSHELNTDSPAEWTKAMGARR